MFFQAFGPSSGPVKRGLEGGEGEKITKNHVKSCFSKLLAHPIRVVQLDEASKGINRKFLGLIRL